MLGMLQSFKVVLILVFTIPSRMHVYFDGAKRSRQWKRISRDIKSAQQKNRLIQRITSSRRHYNLVKKGFRTSYGRAKSRRDVIVSARFSSVMSKLNLKPEDVKKRGRFEASSHETWMNFEMFALRASENTRWLSV